MLLTQLFWRDARVLQPVTLADTTRRAASSSNHHAGSHRQPHLPRFVCVDHERREGAGELKGARRRGRGARAMERRVWALMAARVRLAGRGTPRGCARERALPSVVVVRWRWRQSKGIGVPPVCVMGRTRASASACARARARVCAREICGWGQSSEAGRLGVLCLYHVGARPCRRVVCNNVRVCGCGCAFCLPGWRPPAPRARAGGAPEGWRGQWLVGAGSWAWPRQRGRGSRQGPTRE